MAIPVFQINGTTIHGVTANWQRVIKRETPEGIVYQDWLIHTWDIEQQGMTAALVIQALAGNDISSLATTDVDDRANGATYTNVEMISMANYTHVGKRATSLRVEFRIKP